MPTAVSKQALCVGAIAVSDRRANAVGPLRLSCERDGLRIDLLRVGRFAAGFAFVGLADVVSFRVPYSAVRGLVSDGHLLLLSLDEAAASPYTRFALTHFSRDPDAALMRVFRVRASLSLLSWALPLPLAAAAAWWLPRHLVGGPLGIAAVAALVAWLSFLALRRLVHRVSWGGASADRLRARFEQCVSEHLGLELAPLLGEEQSATDQAPSVQIALGAVARTRLLALTLVLATLGAVASLVVVQRYGVADKVVLPVDPLRAGVAQTALQQSRAAFQEGVPDRKRCDCTVADSPLWREGIGPLSVLVSMRKGRLDELWLTPGRTYQIKLDDPGLLAAEGRDDGDEADDDEQATRPRVELDLALVNNAALSLKTVDLVVTFARRGPQGERRSIIERGLHWPKRLRPGEAVKWRVRARGTELRVDLHKRIVKPAGALAPADAFFGLADARLRAARVHGAMMLAYLRDPRAAALARDLSRLSTLEEQARTEVLAALEPLQLCDVKHQRSRLSGCLFNGTSELQRGLTVRELGVSEPRTWPIRDLFVAGQGLSVSLPLGASDRLPAALVVDPLSP